MLLYIARYDLDFPRALSNPTKSPAFNLLFTGGTASKDRDSRRSRPRLRRRCSTESCTGAEACRAKTKGRTCAWPPTPWEKPGQRYSFQSSVSACFFRALHRRSKYRIYESRTVFWAVQIIDAKKVAPKYSPEPPWRVLTYPILRTRNQARVCCFCFIFIFLPRTPFGKSLEFDMRVTAKRTRVPSGER